VGTQTLELVAANPGQFRVAALTAQRNVALLAAQARQLLPQRVVIGEASLYGDLKAALAGLPVEVAAGAAAITEAAQMPSDWVMAAIVGAAGLAPTLAAVRRGATVAFANKECLVSAGALMMREVAAHGATLLPVDSEHNAIFQVLEQGESVSRLILTASGGPFRNFSTAAMAQVTVQQALKHPVWAMGAKISIDSATMMNKGLEIIEACYLFGMAESSVAVLVHPQSVIHSMVEYQDGSVLAQLGSPDMRTPIAYALAFPRRMATPVERLDLVKIATLSFEAPDETRFPALRLAREAARRGDSAPAILNAANEVAVAAFLAGQIGFLQIAQIVAKTLEKNAIMPLCDIDAVMAADQEARHVATQAIKGL